MKSFSNSLGKIVGVLLIQSIIGYSIYFFSIGFLFLASGALSCDPVSCNSGMSLNAQIIIMIICSLIFCILPLLVVSVFLKAIKVRLTGLEKTIVILGGVIFVSMFMPGLMTVSIYFLLIPIVYILSGIIILRTKNVTKDGLNVLQN